MMQFDKNKTAEEAFFKKVTAPFKEDKAAIWERMAQQLEEQPSKARKVRKISIVRWAAAASILLIIGAAAFARFYTVKIETALAEQTTIKLPDGSTVELNAASQISYAPYWWWMNRTLKFEGEGFFKVEKGSAFTVESTFGKTTVLGTSFNIKTYRLAYEVFCATGKVKVNVGEQEEILTSGESAKLLFKLGLQKQEPKVDQVMAWRENKFAFENSYMNKVVGEMERQYAVKISYPKKLEAMRYSAYYDKPTEIEQALNLICLTLKLKYRKISDHQYQLYQ